MKFSPKSLAGNINVSRTHPLVEFLWLVGGLLAVAGIVFVSLGLLTDVIVSRIPVRAENWLGSKAMERFPSMHNDGLQRRLDALLGGLPPESPLRRYNFRALLMEKDEINAIALPGGNIVVFSGLLRQVQSENELAMVLYHELGHYAHRDHLRGLGRGLGLTVGMLALFGYDSVAGDLVSRLLLSYQASYSQNQEVAADAFALDLLIHHYGHAGGSTDFFSRLAATGKNRIPYLLASHPHPGDRIEKLNNLIAEHGFTVGTTIPLADDLKIR